MNNKKNRMQEFLNSNEFKTYQKSLFEFIYLEMDDNKREKLRTELKDNLLSACFKLNSYYTLIKEN